MILPGAIIPREQVQDKPGCMAVIRHSHALPVTIEFLCKPCGKFVAVMLPPGATQAAMCPTCFASGLGNLRA